ncbi:virulence-associated E family protein [Salimicrobium halophilum]|uniref:Virulence-associated protein E n=1 Tax=Salimicrobium halophilum TaxID=86666 RepID=A0A1G8WEC0_9BACI|nr:virulence-associated E family protein [Salimicrobium halophilum]SDJ76543.1 Virulence-associated protein E [Salimicrobium halophilum]
MKLEKPNKLKHLQHDGELSIATADNRMAKHWRNKELTWSDFLTRISETVRTKESATEYLKMKKAQQDEIKDVGGFVGGMLKEGRRKAGNVFNRTLLTLDIDYGEEGMPEIIDMLFGHAYALYSTHKHREYRPRLRFIAPLSRPVTAEEYVAIGKKVAEQIGIDYFDDTTYQAHRLMYWPSTSEDAEFIFTYQDETWLDPDDVLNKYIDWRDPLEWPASSRQQQDYKRLADKQGDPYEKPGLVGTFNRTYSIEGAMEAFLPGVYEYYQEDRYTYNEGSTAGGLVLYDNGKFAYSHHGTDPTSSMLVNAFDFVRMHLFSEQDEDAKPDAKVTELPSYKAMRDLAQNDEEVKAKVAEERMEAAKEEFDELDVEDTEWPDHDDGDEKKEKWTKKLVLNKQGEVDASVPNILLILENDPFVKKRIATNEFTQRLTLLKDVPWRKANMDHWTDGDDAGLRDYLERFYGIYNKAKTEDAVKVMSERHSFHPVRDYLTSLEWDGTERLDTLLIDYLGAEDSDLNRAVTRKAFTAAVARIMEPGIKFDYMLTLYGPQGIGKSMLINRMGQQWFSDSVTTVTGKEAFEQLQGAWIIELGELSATRKTDVESIKHFISKQEDRYRVAYGKNIEDFPRQCVFFGTTNDVTFLKDKTGNRRFWPVTVNADKQLFSWKDLTDDDINQLWAEAKHRYEQQEPLFLPDGLEAEMKETQEAHTEESPWFGLVQEYLDTKLPEDWYERDIGERRTFLDSDFGDSPEGTMIRDRVCALEIWVECLGNSRNLFRAQDRREINDILRNMPGWKPNDSTKKGTLRFGKEYGVQRAYIRKNSN